ncbi:MAG TPA: ABC transporter permease [Saprospiraceae bacterium]|nr:ABC transporter permease [Saprospiraceae bacterium]HPG07777.1 ABC transporter permease [Saprospiraceae bacterium]HRV84466.1 ABC transporter permease [Saprospiraceae bacterium]
MFNRDTWQEIWMTIKQHKLRTFLTVLGVFWGVFMLIFMLGMGSGLENAVFRDFGNRATNIMYVWSSSTSLPYQGYQPGRFPRLNFDDLEAIKQQVKGVGFIAPRTRLDAKVVHGETAETYEIRGELSQMIKVEALKVYHGRYISDLDNDESRKVAVLGTRTAEVLFGRNVGEAIGQYVTINGAEFLVVGIFGPRVIKPWTEDDQEAVVIPLTTMHRTFGMDGRVHYFAVSAQEGYRIAQIEPQVRSLLKARHHVAPNDPRGIGGFNLEAEFQQVRGLFDGISAFLWIVGIGTLLAGIVGVSNIMLIVVKERTKEIGIRKAIGATPASIISSILTESIFITAVSGYLGLLAGVLVIGGINLLMEQASVDSQMFYNPEVNLGIAIGAMILLTIAGTVAGLIPAMMAARVNPVVALKDE